MALLKLDDMLPHVERNSIIAIPTYRTDEAANFACYKIQIHLDMYTWTVERRYSEFVAFDVKRFPDRKKSFIPPKKYVRNMDPEFLNERRMELEKYIRTVLELELWLQKKNGSNQLPKLLARFLEFHQYEVHAVVDDLAEQLSKSGERWLLASAAKPKYFEFTPIELFAVTQRMSLAEPTHERSADIAHLVEFLHCVKNLKIRGARGYIGTSNVLWNALPFSLHLCKNVLALWLTDCDVKMVSGLDHIRKSAKRIVVHYSMKNIEDLLLESSNVDDPNLLERWQRIEEVDFSFNDIVSVHSSIVLLKTMQRLNLSHNKIVGIGDQLQHLAFLTEVDLSHNAIEEIDEWHTKLGNIKVLNLAGNKIANIHGLRKLYSLQTLDLSDNVIVEMESASAVGNLPILEKYDLRGNPVLNTIEYRTRVFESFGDRFIEIELDGKKADERERDTVAVRLALQKAKKEREDMAKLRKLQIDERIRFLSGEEHIARSV